MGNATLLRDVSGLTVAKAAEAEERTMGADERPAPLRFAVLGWDETAARLVRTLVADGHRFAAFDPGPQRTGAAPSLQLPSAPRESWDGWLSGAVADVVLVARDADQDALRKLVQAGLSLGVVHPACPAIVGHELDMIRRDTLSDIVPYVAEGLHPAVARLAEACRSSESELGGVEQLTIERFLADRSNDGVLRQFACDAALIRAIVGEIDRLAALGSEATLANVSVHATGPTGAVVQWSAAPAPPPTAPASADALLGRMTVRGPRGTAVLQLAAEESSWRIDWPDGRTETFPQADSAALWAARLVAGSKSTASSPVPVWEEACRDQELAETLVRSLRRGRTIPIYRDEYTEENSFKGAMALGGCLLILLTLFGLLGLAIVEGFLAPYRDEVATDDSLPPPLTVSGLHRWLRWWPVVPLAIFLLLQFLLFVARGASKSAKPESAD